jgi:hypothetical protein
MKTHFLSLALLLGTTGLVFGQETEKKDSTEKQVTIVIKTVPKKSGSADTIYISKQDKHEHKRHRTFGNDWYFDIGMNNYVENGSFPSENGKSYRVKNGLDYFAVGSLAQRQLGGRGNPAFLKAGLELSFNAFMFENDSVVARGATQVTFNPNINPANVSKSKLGVSYLSVPVMFVLDYDKVNRGKLKIGIGGYAGLRLKSWSKVKYSDGNKDKTVDSFYMKDIRYGLMGQVGIGWVTIFAKYDLNPLFTTGRGFDTTQDLHTLDIGIRL